MPAALCLPPAPTQTRRSPPLCLPPPPGQPSAAPPPSHGCSPLPPSLCGSAFLPRPRRLTAALRSASLPRPQPSASLPCPRRDAAALPLPPSPTRSPLPPSLFLVARRKESWDPSGLEKGRVQRSGVELVEEQSVEMKEDNGKLSFMGEASGFELNDLLKASVEGWEKGVLGLLIKQ